MKSILMSFKPKWVDKILKGEKAVEIRKTSPKCELPIKVYIYCSKGKKLYYRNGKITFDPGEVEFDQEYIDNLFDFREVQILNGKVVGEFVCNRIDNVECASYKHNYYSCLAGMTNEELQDYSGGKKLYAWDITDLKIYEEPKELEEFHRFCGNDGDGCPDSDCPYYEDPNEYGEVMHDCESCRPIERAPQSWMYVEAL